MVIERVDMKKIITVIIVLMSLTCLNAYYYGKNKIQPKKIDWMVIQTKHFDIHYANDEEFGKTIAYASEKAFYHLNSFFKQTLNGRIPIIVYESKQQFQTTNIIYPLLSEGVGGFTESVRNRVVVPFDGSYKKFEEVLIHELTHAYINNLNGDIFSSMVLTNNSTLPFWFSEGLPEYMSIGGVDNYNNMFILDLVLNDKLYPLDKIYGYYAYRLGEAFLTWVSVEYGHEMVSKLFYEIQINSDMDVVCQKLFGQKFEPVEKRFRIYLKKKYYPVIQDYASPSEKTDRLTDYNKFKANMNYSPKISPKGDKILFFSNKMSTIGLWELLTFKKTNPKKILSGESSGNFEEFHFQRSNLSWFSDSRRVAFVSKTAMTDVVYIYDTKKHKIMDKISFDDAESLYEIDVSKNDSLLVISAQVNKQNNLYLYDLKTKQRTEITHDKYQDSQPRWSYDNKMIAFVSERTLADSSKYDHIFSKLTKNIFVYNLETKDFTQVTFDNYNNYAPLWKSDNTEILYVSEENHISNLKTLRLSDGKRADVFKFYSGIQDADLSSDNDLLVFTCFYDSAWDVYSLAMPLLNLDYKDYRMPEKVEFKDNFNSLFKIENYRFYGSSDSLPQFQKPPKERMYRPKYSGNDKDSLYFNRKAFLEKRKSVESKPDTLNFFNPKFMDYKPKLMIDQFWGGLAYSSYYGTVGQLQLGLSDLMGNHAVGVNLEFNGKLKDSNIILSYLYLPYKLDYGFAGYHTTDEVIYLFPDNRYRRLTERKTGGYFLLRYPLNKFFRLDFEQSLSDYQREWKIWNSSTGYWDNIPDGNKYSYSYTPSFSLVYDNALYGATGPMIGTKGFYTIKKNFSEANYEYLTNYLDFRHYLPISETFSLASRVILARSSGKNPELFNLYGFNGVRGMDYNNNILGKEYYDGNTKVLQSLELRFPFVDYLKLGFPLPITIGDIRGSLFTDFGSVWKWGDPYRGAINGKLNDLKFGFGFGPRMNIGYFVLKLDVAWSSNFIDHGKPSYYFSINEDF